MIIIGVETSKLENWQESLDNHFSSKVLPCATHMQSTTSNADPGIIDTCLYIANQFDFFNVCNNYQQHR